MTLPFGKYKGQFVSDIPSSYLVWLFEEGTLKEDSLKSSIRIELDFRFALDNKELKSLKNIYHQLAKKYHPDKGGNVEAMKALNEFYTKMTNG